MILIDDRIGSKELVDLIDDGILVNLDYGDVTFEGEGPKGKVQIGCERKKIGDLINSISTGRLSGHQLPGLLENYYKVYLLIEGICRENPRTKELEILKGTKWIHASRGNRKFNYSTIWAYLTTLETFTGISVRTTANMAETARHIEWLYNWWQKSWEKHRGHLQIHKIPPPTTRLMPIKPPLIVRLASELPGIGWGRAGNVGNYFGSMKKMIQASEEEWREVEGIGKLTAKKAWEALHD